MTIAPRDLALASPALRECDYWYGIILRAIDATADAGGVLPSIRIVFAYSAAVAVQRELAGAG